jgi:hypothetical protein
MHSTEQQGRNINKTVKSKLFSGNFPVSLFYSQHFSALYVMQKAKSRKKHYDAAYSM